MSAWNWKSFLFLVLFIAVWLLHLQINDLNHIFSKSNKLNNCKWCGLKTRGVWDKMTTCPKIKFSWFLFVLFCVQNLCCTALKKSLIRFSDRVVGEWNWCIRGDFIPWILHFFLFNLLICSFLFFFSYFFFSFFIPVTFTRRRFVFHKVNILQLFFNCWFSHDVTKIQTTKLSMLPRFYFHDVLEKLKTNFHRNFLSSKGFLVLW